MTRRLGHDADDAAHVFDAMSEQRHVVSSGTGIVALSCGVLNDLPQSAFVRHLFVKRSALVVVEQIAEDRRTTSGRAAHVAAVR